MNLSKKQRPEKTAQELTGKLAELIAEHARPESGMADVRFIATPLLKSMVGECNWRAVIVSPATEEQRRIVDWAATVVQMEWNMLERRKSPRL